MTNPTSKKDDGPVLTIITDNVGPIVSTSQLDMELEMVDIDMNVDMVECNSRSNLADMGVPHIPRPNVRFPQGGPLRIRHKISMSRHGRTTFTDLSST
jgi:hypothetical protein